VNNPLQIEDIFFSIISCKKFISTRQKHLKLSWVNNINYIFASDVNTEDNVQLTLREGHISAVDKQLNSIDYLLSNFPNFEWYFFCDDDTFVNVKNLICYLNSLPKSVTSVGKVLSFNTDPQNPMWTIFDNDFGYYSGGAGFAVRKDLLIKLNSKNLKLKSKYSDVSMGFLMIDEVLHDCNLFNSQNPITANHSENKIKTCITYHFVKEDIMKALYDFVNK